MKTNYYSFVFVTLLLLQSLGYAQLPYIEPGTKIRVTSPDFFSPVIAKVQKSSSDSLSILLGNRVMELSNIQIKKIETATRVKRHTIEGFILGAIPGALISGAYFYNAEKKAEGFEKVGQPGVGGGIALGILVGGITGGLIGHSMKTEVWKQIYPKAKICLDKEKSYSKYAPGLAFTMSLLLPGLGQYYNGDTKKGIIQDILFFGGIFLAAKSSDDNSTQELIGGSLAFGSYLWSIIDAPISASKKNQQLLRNRSENESMSKRENINLGFTASYRYGAICAELLWHF